MVLVFFHKNDEREELLDLIYDFWKVCMLAILNVFFFVNIVNIFLLLYLKFNILLHTHVIF